MNKLLILFLLLPIIYSDNKTECNGKWTETSKGYCSTLRKENKTLITFKEDCVSGTCSESSLIIKSSCETKWVEGFCFNKIDNQINKTITSEEMCLQEKGTWTMKYCELYDFDGAMYNTIRNKFNNATYDKSKHFSRETCNLFGLIWETEEEEEYCYFESDGIGEISNEYLCVAVGGYWNYNKKICSKDLDSEGCQIINGKNWGQCDLFEEQGYLKDKCDSINAKYWKKGVCYDDPDYTEEECPDGSWMKGFCLIADEMVTKQDECNSQNRTWSNDESNSYVWTEAQGVCENSMFIRVKYFMFILGLLICL